LVGPGGSQARSRVEGYSDVDNEDVVYAARIEIDDTTMSRLDPVEMCLPATGECFYPIRA
jgi:hypothetical protein